MYTYDGKRMKIYTPTRKNLKTLCEVKQARPKGQMWDDAIYGGIKGRESHTRER